MFLNNVLSLNVVW